MKKIVSLLLALVMVLSLGVAAFAVDAEDANTTTTEEATPTTTEEATPTTTEEAAPTVTLERSSLGSRTPFFLRSTSTS